jgi:hypothetical protein
MPNIPTEVDYADKSRKKNKKYVLKALRSQEKE